MHMLETGQDWKVAALIASMRVHIFFGVKYGKRIYKYVK